MKKNNSHRKGFTLIELLVVITIIGILAGIAFVGFGDVFGTAGRTAAQKNLKTVYESLAAKTRNFPTTDDVGSAEEFAAWFRKKTKDTRPELWFLPDDEMVVELNEDGSDGVPANIPADVAPSLSCGLQDWKGNAGATTRHGPVKAGMYFSVMVQ
jgi:prepilin-type N-terminal cleavage/methylation domain-containing protein